MLCLHCIWGRLLRVWSTYNAPMLFCPWIGSSSAHVASLWVHHYSSSNNIENGWDNNFYFCLTFSLSNSMNNFQIKHDIVIFVVSLLCFLTEEMHSFFLTGFCLLILSFFCFPISLSRSLFLLIHYLNNGCHKMRNLRKKHRSLLK
jgi:hypothetical protein